MENIIKQLEKLGILGKEAEVYIELLKAKEATVIQISRNTEIKRTSVYYCLDALVKKGVIGMIERDSKKLYFAEDPKNSLGNLVKQQESTIRDLLPQIKDIYGKGSSLPAIKIYHNLAGIKNVFDDLLSCQEKVGRYYVSDFSVDEMLGEAYLKAFVKKRISLGIKSLSMRSGDYMPEREQDETSVKQLRETRVLPANLNSCPYMCIYDNKTVVISAKEKMGFIIESQEFATAQKAIFDMIWNISQTSPNNLELDNANDAKNDDYWSA
jgi:sugar-specific transcriptional regulator TrmB